MVSIRLHQYILALVLWLLFLFNVERIDIAGSEVVNIPASIYLLTVALIVLSLLLPRLIRLSLLSMNVVALSAFVALGIAPIPPFWSGESLPMLFFEVSAVLISVSLAHIVGQSSVDFVDTVRSLLFVDTPNLVQGVAESRSRIDQEIQRARRENCSFSVIVVQPDGEEGAELLQQATAQEIRALLTRRHYLVALARLLAWRVRRTDVVIERSHEGRLILVTPRVEKDKATEVISRLSAYIHNHLAVNLDWGVASFPEEGVTFEDLLYQASENLGVQPSSELKDSVGAHHDAGATSEDRSKAHESENVASLEDMPTG